MDKETIYQILKEKIASVVEGIDDKRISESTSLKELGLNSIDRAEVIMLILEALQLKASLVDFGVAKNIGELCEIFRQKYEMMNP